MLTLISAAFETERGVEQTKPSMLRGQYTYAEISTLKRNHMREFQILVGSSLKTFQSQRTDGELRMLIHFLELSKIPASCTTR
jgi:hypothetical protein